MVWSEYGYPPKQGLYSPDLEKDAGGVGFVAKINGERSYQSVVNTMFVMENEANGLEDSFVARHTTDPALRLELLSRNQNGSRLDRVTEIGAEISVSSNIATDSPATVSPPTVVFPSNSQGPSLFAFIRPWNVESLDSTNNSPLALVQGVARATVQMNRGIKQRKQRELEHREQLTMDRIEAEIGMRRGSGSMISREVDLIDRMNSLSFIEQHVEGAGTSVTRRLNALTNEIECHQFPGVESKVIGFLPQVRSRSNVLGSCQHRNSSGTGSHQNGDLFVSANRERNAVVSYTEETCVQRSGGSATNRNYGSEFVHVESNDNSLLEMEQRVEDACGMVQRVLRERERKEFDREIERKEHEIRTERARKKREREARELQEVSMWPQQHFPAFLCNFNEQSEENLTGEGSGRHRILMDYPLHHDISKCNACLYKRIQEKSKSRSRSGQDECCICLKDSLSGCQILRCSHKVHRECAIAIIQNGVRRCPICRQPLFD